MSSFSCTKFSNVGWSFPENRIGGFVASNPVNLFSTVGKTKRVGANPVNIPLPKLVSDLLLIASVYTNRPPGAFTYSLTS